jgi:chromosome segregation ATPase
LLEKIKNLEIELSKEKIFQYNNQQLQRQIADLEDRNHQLEAKKSELEEEIIHKNNTIIDLENKNSLLQNKLSKKKSKVQEALKTKDSLQEKVEFAEQVLEKNQEEFKVDMKLIEKLHAKIHHRKQAFRQLQREMEALRFNEQTLQVMLEKNETIYANKLTDSEWKAQFLEKNIQTLKGQLDKLQISLLEKEKANAELRLIIDKLKQELAGARNASNTLGRKLNDVFSVDEGAQNRNVLFRSVSPDTFKSINVTLLNQRNCLNNLLK